MLEKSVLILAPISNGSGNLSTGLRILNGLKDRISNCCLENTHNFETYKDLKLLINEKKIDLILCLHAYHSGRLFSKNITIPIITIFGGTDIHSASDGWKDTIELTVTLSKYLVCFSNEIKQVACKLWPFIEHKCVIIPQAVCINDIQSFATLNINDSKLNKSSKIVSWVGGIRQVKDPLFVQSILNDVYSIDPTIIFVFAGYPLDNNLTNKIKQLEIENPNFIYINGINTCQSHTLIANSWAYLNTSINEGMALSILEAMKLRVPVIVRANFGNLSIVKHKFNGLVFKNCAEFIENVKLLLTSTNDYNDITTNAFDYVNVNHNFSCETESYLNTIKICL